ncbi:MAG: dihydroorotase [Candidatus Muiribacteriota bacterium]
MFKIIKNIRFPFQGKETLGSVVFDDKIKSFIHGTDIELKIDGEVVDGGGKLLLPGFIDPHVHFNTPGFEERETFENGSRGAIKGGVTSIIDMPCTSLPPVVDSESYENKLKYVKNQAWCDYAFHGGVSGNLFEKEDFNIFSALSDLSSAGITALKVYTKSGMETFKELNNDELIKTMRAAAHKRIPVLVHAEEPTIINSLQKKFMKENKNKPIHYYNSRPEESELMAINTVGYLSLLTGATVHIVHISTASGVKLIEDWNNNGAHLSCETCPHFLEFNFRDFENKGAILKTAPVVKTPEDSKNLWKYLNNNLISFLTTDHAPCRFEGNKDTGSIWDDYSGIPGVETVYPFIISEGYLSNKISLNNLLKICCQNQARLFGLYPRKGSLLPGADADFVLVDTDKEWVVDSSKFESIGKFSPFDGRTFKGAIETVYLRGEPVVENNRLLKKKGDLLKR